MLKRFLLLCLLFAGWLATPGGAIAAQVLPGNEASGVVTIDVAHLYAVVPLDARWRYQSGDDVRYREPSFDDAAWPLLGSGQALTIAGMPMFTWGNAWVRLRLHLVGTTGPLGMDLKTLGGQQYEVFANGRRIAASRGILAGIRQRSSPFTISLPQSNDVVLAIRLSARPSLPAALFPLTAVRIGPLGAMAQATELERIRNFDEHWLSNVFSGFIYLLFLPVGLTLSLARRDHTEYLWLTLLFAVGSAYTFLAIADGMGALPESNPNVALYLYCGFGTLMTGLEFILRFTGSQRVLPVRVFQGVLVCGPLLFLIKKYVAYDAVLGSCLVVWVVMVVVYLVASYRRGQVESGLLLLSFASVPASELLSLLADHFGRFGRFDSHLHLGHVGVGLDDLGSLIFVLGIFAVVLYRFIRISQNEERASAELQAARSVQKVLIPESIPTLAGYLISSVYQPAQQVGGDFFQIIPMAGEHGALIVLGDVSGKGLEAAMTVAVLVGAIRTLVDYVQSPGELMGGLNRRLHGRASGFTTCLILRIGTGGLVTAANAGHLSPYLKGVELELAAGLPLGVLLDTTYVESTFVLPPGEVLAMMTDGVVEAMNPKTHELFGFERTQAVSMHSAAVIAEAACRFGTGAPQTDDITVLTLRVDPRGS